MEDIRQEFVGMMNRLTKKNAKLSDVVLTKDLEKSCAEIQRAIMPYLSVDIKKGYEPCPFYFSGSDKLAEMVFVGLNPGNPLKIWKQFSADSTWEELAEFCAPAKGILADEDNGYQYVAKNIDSNRYYQIVLLIHQALFGNAVYDEWSQLQQKIGKDNIGRFFLDCFSEHPILNADLLPYKSSSAAFSVAKLAQDEGGSAYMDGLVELIQSKSTKDAYVIFFGAPKAVMNILEKRLSSQLEKEWEERTLCSLSGKKTFSVFFNKWKQRKLILSPFCGRRNGCYKVSELKKNVKQYF